ncbi:MAG TPA: hypothetical protein VMW01_12050 [Williamwhitmania sp.]|nr:hypothetical protein [Williamwhitmania sp.]
MALEIDASKKILLDADVIIHFIKGEQTGILHQIFPNKLYILDVVFGEVFKANSRIIVENLIRSHIIFELSFSGDIEVMREYGRLRKIYGKGESACMAYCKFNKDVLASSNLRDIKLYCQQHGIQYLTTMDFVYKAHLKGILDEAECDYFIYNVLSKGSKLPCSNLAEYIRLLER